MKIYEIKTKQILQLEYITNEQGIFYIHSLDKKELKNLGFLRVVEKQMPELDEHSEIKEIKRVQEDICYLSYEIEPRVITLEQLKAGFIREIDAILDAKAREYGYDNINTAVSYAGYENSFQQEAIAFGKWRSSVWEWGYALQDRVVKGEVDVSSLSIDNVIKDMPQLRLDK